MGRTPPEVMELDAGGHPVVAGDGALQVLGERLAAMDGAMPIVLGDHHTLHHCLPELLAHVPLLSEAGTVAVDPGETSKSIEVCRDIWTHLTGLAADRHAVLICLGGGVVTDIGGFIAGTYKRGIRCMHVPTSLMGMVDAAIGGKAAIDLGGVKNVVGVFHDPVGVFVHVPFLRTLGKRELLNGVAEMVKHGVVSDADHFEAVRSAPLHDIGALAPLIVRSAAIKAEVVRADPRESGLRKLLNFGHTIGHGIEAHSWESPHRALLHGEAIAVGMVCEAWIARSMGLFPHDDHERLTAFLLDLFNLGPLEDMADHRIIELMRNDKKNAGGAFRLTLPTAIGSARVDVPVTAEQVREALEQYRPIVRDAQRDRSSA